MSKTKQSFGMDLNDEASKLLEKALSSFDGIILGKLFDIIARKIAKVLIFSHYVHTFKLFPIVMR